MQQTMRKIGIFLMMVGDAALLFASLYLALAVRNLVWPSGELWEMHVAPFARSFVLWIAVFFIFGLYDIRITKNGWDFARRMTKAFAINALITALAFYFDSTTRLTPKTTLVLTILFSAAFLFAWRLLFNKILAASSKNRVLFFGVTDEVITMAERLHENPQFGYETGALMQAENEKADPRFSGFTYSFDHNLRDIIARQSIDTIVVSASIRENKTLIRMFFEIIPLGVAVVEFPDFYERITGKIPVSLIRETWFLEHLVGGKNHVLDFFERVTDIALAILLLPFAAVIIPVLALLIRLDSRGPAFYSQKRLGKNNRPIEIVKLRTMVTDAEREGARWADENDPRVTRVGAILRKTRLDELPQIWSVLKGDLSFVGPRPERPEFVETLRASIPFYDMRHLVKPGLTGWAQINFPYGASVEDALEKLQYDLYYLKNRSLTLNFAIYLRTIFIMFSRGGR